MKKLMVILGAALMCSAASAATVLWSASEKFADSAGVAFSKTRDIAAYLFDAASVTQSDLFNSWKEGSANTAGAKVVSTWYAAFTLDVTSQIGDSGTKMLYWAVINGQDLFISSTITQTIAGIGETEFSWRNESGSVFTGADAFGSAGWYVIPEPTSGLLLLIGIAGLALKRTRA